MLKLGITGGIGAGKSIVCKIFSNWGVPVFNADFEARDLMIFNKELVKKIKLYFGDLAYNEDGTLNKTYISEIVFNDRVKLAKLNKMVHPFVKELFLLWAMKQDARYVIEEAAILFESGSDKNMDKTVLVYCEKETRIKRIVKRNNIPKEQIEKIMANQLDEEEKCKKADYIVYNNEKTLLLPQLIKIHKELTAI